MSPSAFDVLRAKRPERIAAIEALQGQLSTTLARNAEALIEDDRLVQQLHEQRETIQDLLQDLVYLGCLQILFLWKCPNSQGTSAEAYELSQFPEEVECDRCGKVHAYDPAAIEVCFEATDRLRIELRR